VYSLSLYTYAFTDDGDDGRSFRKNWMQKQNKA
jgi:hypothetical protein